MKILLLTESDTNYGGYAAVPRLFAGLRAYGVNVELGVLKKTSKDSNIIVFLLKNNRSKVYLFARNILKIFGKILGVFIKKKFITSNTIGHSEAKTTNIDINEINNSDYDLIHLHWIYTGVISIEDLPKIKKPLIFTMHDSWVFCGAEYHPNIIEDDIRYIEGYSKKNKPATTYGIDICRKTWERKIQAWKNISINFISPSNFEKKLLQESFLFRGAECVVIPNVVPNKIFKKLNRNDIREMYNIPLSKKIIGFGAASLTNRKTNKGEYLFLEALKNIKDKDNYFILLFGNADLMFIDNIEFPLFDSGAITNSYVLASLYNICDIFVCPSLVENLSTVCIEAQFCGLPVAAFNTGGIPDIVEHKETGYLATPFDPADLYNGMIYCIENAEKLSQKGIIRMNKIFNNENIINRHISYYQCVIGAKK